MKKNEIYVKKVFKDKKTNTILYILVQTYNSTETITLRKLNVLKKKGYKLVNAVLTINNVLRAKSGTLDVEYIEKKQTGLQIYRNQKSYDGNSDKYGITWKDGNDYIVKLPKKEGDTSIFSEYVASTLMEKLGYNVHHTLLTLDNDTIVVLLRDFTGNNEFLRSYEDTRQSSEDTSITHKEYTYEDVIDMIKKHTKLTNENKKNALYQFWDMYMLDAILANRDRHCGNWGYICSSTGYRIAPIYDNGSSLFSDVKVKLNEYIKDRRKFLEERCEKFPASLLCVYDDNLKRIKRTNYYEIVGLNTNSPEKNLAYNKIKSFGIQKIYDIISTICNNEYIDKTLSQFYVDIICIRYMHIILRLDFAECYRRLLSLCQRGHKE